MRDIKLVFKIRSESLKIYKKRLIAGVMALLLGCSTLFTASAADTAKNAKNLKDMAEELPELPGR